MSVFLKNVLINFMSKPIIFSAIQPTGNLHIGNYLGAVKNWVDLQNSGKYEMYLAVADWHSLTGKLSAIQLREQKMMTVAELLAVGIDPKKVTFFMQSDVIEHAELSWIFSCTTPIAELYRMTQFKDKAERQEKNINAGLLTYPILQAADILMYKGELVPVGLDQVQHVELTRDIARWFNKKYGEFFPETKHLLTDVPKVMSLLEPIKKMSKSLGAGHVIELIDSPEEIEKKLKKAVTATEGGEKAPGVENLLLLLKYFGKKEIHAKFVASEKDKTIRYGDLKKAVGESLYDYFAGFRMKRKELLNRPEEIKKILASGAEKAQKVAKGTMEEVRKMIGIK